MLQYEYAREALKTGLRLGVELGTNPFKFGVIGSTDSHTSLATAAEENFFGKHTGKEPSEHRWNKPVLATPAGDVMGWEQVSSGLAAVWATENTRESIWDAMNRREVYGTTGPRILVRFWGGWDFVASDAASRLPAEIGYTKGVAMGGDLPAAPPGKAPTFLVAALKDPYSGNLDRIQIIKGWLDAKGQTHEKVYDVVWGDAERRRPGRDGKVPPVGSTVDVANATWSNTIGDPELITVWEDPDFDPTRPAFYYARVIEIPTPRWTAYDAKRYGITMSSEVPMTTQERAYTRASESPSQPIDCLFRARKEDTIMNARILVSCWSACLLFGSFVAAQDPAPSEEGLRDAFPGQKHYSPFAGRNFPTQVFWGDTHLHTGMSMDAGAFGARLLPEDAYRFARGEELTSSTGLKVKLARPLDFLVVADHSDNMGFFPRLYAGDRQMLADPTGRRWYDMVQEGGQQGVAAAVEIIVAFSQNQFPEALASLPGDAAFRSAWDVAVGRGDQRRREVQRPGPFHGVHRLRVDVEHGWQQPAPGGRLPGRRFQGKPRGTLHHPQAPGQRQPPRSLEVDGGVRAEDHGADARHRPQRQPEQRDHVPDRRVVYRQAGGS
jgi:hypothetical protein